MMNRVRAVFYLLLLSVTAAQGEEYAEAEVTDSDREHWSFAPLNRPSVPKPSYPEWERSKIDRFITRTLKTMKLEPESEASGATLLRRLHFDLLGLPPSPVEIAKFENDRRPDAYERTVETLLASPRYGEHWGQRWLDLARFAETDGFEHDKVRPNAWKYRDWVVATFNGGVSYDQFLQAQLAGDLLEDERSLPTAFCLSGPDMPDINSQSERKHNLANEITATVGSVFLGLQIGCAQCHDHVFDPISQGDFYRLRAFFDRSIAPKRDQSLTTLLPAVDSRFSSHIMIRGDWKRPGAKVQPDYPRVANRRIQKGQRRRLSRLDLANWLTDRSHPLTARVFVNRIWQHHFGKGLSNTPSDFGVMGEEPSHPQLLDWLAVEFIESGWNLKQLHRSIVLTSTYRQRSWRSEISHDWTRKLEADPEARFLSRFPRRRLDAEVIRDAIFAVSDSLNLVSGGPSVRPPLPKELSATLLRGQWKATTDKAQHYRRSIYVFARRNLRYPMFAAFDRPAANSSCPRRAESTTAPQSLLMLNSDISLDAARRLAGQVYREVGHKPSELVRRVVTRVWNRSPSIAEQRLFTEFLAQQRDRIEAEGRVDEIALPMSWKHPSDPFAGAALIDFCLAMINSNEFIYLD